MEILRAQGNATVSGAEREAFAQFESEALVRAKWEAVLREKEALLRSERKAAQREKEILLKEGKEAALKEREAFLRKREQAVSREREAFVRAEGEAGRRTRQSWTGERPEASIRPPEATSSQQREGPDIIVQSYEEHRRGSRYQTYAEDAVDRDMERAARESDAVRRAQIRSVSVRRSHERGS